MSGVYPPPKRSFDDLEIVLDHGQRRRMRQTAPMRRRGLPNGLQHLNLSSLGSADWPGAR